MAQSSINVVPPNLVENRRSGHVGLARVLRLKVLKGLKGLKVIMLLPAYR
ncbi:MAG: hypothetical protein H7Y02_00340 [Candidatus Obscuribacterales bacterium]|nr:hypothetical protein [Steroidobacteraceae bacterium]